jgi:hypothetical protein
MSLSTRIICSISRLCHLNCSTQTQRKVSKAVPLHAMQAIRGRTVTAPTHSWPLQDGVSGQLYAPSALCLGERNPETRRIGDWVGPRAGLDTG